MGSIGRWLFFASSFVVLLWWVIPYLRVALANAKAARGELTEQADASISSIPARYDGDTPPDPEEGYGED